MDDLMRYAAALDGAASRGPAPVKRWNPPHKGEIDIVIKSDGTWVHEGSPIRRARLIRLFSTVLKREGDDYFLVTPVEKLQIAVEDAPFVAVLMEAESSGEKQRLHFTTNMNERVVAGPDHRLELRLSAVGAVTPYVHIRDGLEGRIARAVYYDLVALGERRQMKDGENFGVWSDGCFFSFGPAEGV